MPPVRHPHRPPAANPVLGPSSLVSTRGDGPKAAGFPGSPPPFRSLRSLKGGAPPRGTEERRQTGLIHSFTRSLFHDTPLLDTRSPARDCLHMPPGLETNFTGLDWGIVVAYLLVVTVVGFYANRYIGDMADYLVAGRTLRSGLAIATMIGSELGLVTIVYAGEKGFTGGLAALHIGVLAGFVTLLVGLSGFLVVPLRRAGVCTIPEYYEMRFGRGVRVLGGIILALAGILNMGLFLVAGAKFITFLTGIHDPNLLNWVMTILLVLVLLYTVLGGMVSVVVTDYLQFVVLAVGLLASCWLAYQQLGWEQIAGAVQTIHGDGGSDPLAGYGPGYVIWTMFVAGLVSCAVWPTAAMRACSVESEQAVRRLYIWSSIGFLIRWALPVFLGVCALAWIEGRTDLHEMFLPAGKTAYSQQAVPAYLAQLLPAGLIGLVAAGMLAAFMSTHDSYLLCWSAVLTQDVVAPLLGDRLSTPGRLLLTRVFILLIGGFLLVWGLWYPLKADLWDYMAVTGSVYFTGAFVLLLAGLYWNGASRVGAYLTLLCGGLMLLTLQDTPMRAWVDLVLARGGYQLKDEHLGLLTTILCLLAMVFGSLLFPDRRRREAEA